MKKTATLVDSVMVHCYPDTRHYVTSDGKHYAVYVHHGLTDETLGFINETMRMLGAPHVSPVEEHDELGLVHRQARPEGDGHNVVIVSPTTVMECDENGWILTEHTVEYDDDGEEYLLAGSIEAVHEFAPGTTHEEALMAMGYEVA